MAARSIGKKVSGEKESIRSDREERGKYGMRRVTTERERTNEKKKNK